MEAVTGIQQRITQIQMMMAQGPSSAPAALTGTTARGVLGGASLGGSTLTTDSDFASVLASLDGGSSTLATAASQLNSAGVPLSLAGYGNGKIPESALSPISGSSERMWGPAATQLNTLLADAKAAGVNISVTDGYRDYDSQVALASSKGLYSQGGLAAEPGTSEHGWGLAVDLGLDANSQAWMRQNASKYGFVEAVPREPWHWEFHP